jgi:hypothetical protein
VSYLQRPRFNFAGRFEADVSTVNNNPNNFNDATFLPEYDTPGTGVVDPATGQPTGDMTNGWWNPTGSGVWRMIDCRVTSVCSARGDGAADDPALQMLLVDAGDRAPAKLVDLDPMQQMVSQIFGLQVRLVDPVSGEPAFTGELAATPFANIWFNRSVQGDASAFYQAQLTDGHGRGPIWSNAPSASPFVNELRETAGDLPLSIRFVLDAMVLNSKSELFPTGRIVGTIGVAQLGEPRHFVRGRQLFVPLNLTPGDPNYGAPIDTAVNNAVAVVDGTTLVLDVCNSLQTATPGGNLVDAGPITVGLAGTDTFTAIGTLPDGYSGPRWLETTGGIVELPLGEYAAAAASTPLGLKMANPSGGGYLDYPFEAPGGEHVRADAFVFRADPGHPVDVAIYTSKFGRPFDTTVSVALDPFPPSTDAPYLTVLQPRVADPSLPGPPGKAGPPPATPPEALDFPASLQTHNGSATLRIRTSPPNNPRGYIDGQVYTVRPTLATLPAAFVNPWDTISILLFDKTAVPEQPTWWDDVQPILQQYANLYPIMRNVLDLDDYVSVIAHKAMLTAVFSLPEEHPNYMPVTRDLSPTKRRVLLKWLASAGEPHLGEIPPRLSAPNAKLRVRLRPAPLAADAAPEAAPGERDGDISGKDHAMHAILAARTPESPA